MSKNYPYKYLQCSFDGLLSFCKHSLELGSNVIKLSKCNCLNKTEPYWSFYFTCHKNKNENPTQRLLFDDFECLKTYNICELNKDNVIKTVKELYTMYKKLQIQEC